MTPSGRSSSAVITVAPPGTCPTGSLAAPAGGCRQVRVARRALPPASDVRFVNMTSTTTTFTPLSGDGWRDPFPMYRSLRDDDPVHHVADGDYWVLSRFADVFDAARDTDRFSSASGLTFVYGDVDAVGV